MPATYLDAHVHFWDPARLSYPWLAGLPRLQRRFGPEDLLAAAGDDPPEGVVFVQADCARDQGLAEVRWVEELGDPRVRGLVAYAPMDAGDATAGALRELARHRSVRGVRHLVQDEPDPAFCLHPAFVAGVRRLADHGFTFDLCCRPHQLRAAAELARLCPDTTIILDHAGKPDLRAAPAPGWGEDLRAFAARPNTVGKLSGLVTEAGPAPAPLGRVAPAVAELLAAFGPGRLLFGSDWPVVELAADYGSWRATARALVSRLSPGSEAAIFRENARRVYRLA